MNEFLNVSICDDIFSLIQNSPFSNKFRELNAFCDSLVASFFRQVGNLFCVAASCCQHKNRMQLRGYRTKEAECGQGLNDRFIYMFIYAFNLIVFMEIKCFNSLYKIFMDNVQDFSIRMVVYLINNKKYINTHLI